MFDKGTTLAIVLLIAGLIVGGGIGYYAMPPKAPPEYVPPTMMINPPIVNPKVTLGFMASDTAALRSANHTTNR